MDGGMDALSVLAPVNDPVYRDLRKDGIRLDEGDGPEFAEDDSPHVASASDRAGQPSPCRQAQRHAAIGYTDPDQSHFTSRHYWEVGELDPNERTGWLGRLIDVIGVDDNPIQGLSLDGWLLPSLATASKPVAAIDGSSYDLWAPGVWGDVEPLMFEAVQTMGQTAAGSGDLGRVSAGKTADQSIELRGTLDGFGEVTVPSVYPDPDHWFCQNLSSLSAMIDADLPIRCVSVQRTGRLRHPRQPGGDLRRRHRHHVRHARRIPGRPRGPGPGRPRDHPRLFGVRPPPRAERQRHRSRRGRRRLRHGLPASRARWSASSRASPQLDEDDNVLHTSDFRSLYCSILEQWFDVDAAQIIPGASSFARPQIIAS